MSKKNGTPKIYTVLPDEIREMHPHGQWLFDQPNQQINFSTDVEDDHYPVILPWVERLEEFRNSDAAYMEFESPHLPGICYLTRVALDHIVGTMPAWSRKVMARSSKTMQLLDSGTGLPVVRKLPAN